MTFLFSIFDFSYEPELFPGLIYRMMTPKIVLLIFVSGKVVLTGKTKRVRIRTEFFLFDISILGAKVRQEIHDAFNRIYPILKGFRK